jgi:RHS repeat-associated protein
MQRATAGSAFKADFSFDPIGRLSSTFNDAAAGTANDLTIAQDYSPASQIRTQSRDNDAYSWTGSVIVSRNYTTNGLNQYTAAGPASFCYDANGNLTSDGSSVYLYDIENRLVEKRAQVLTTCPTSNYTGTLNASLTYDPMGRLFQVTGPTTNNRFVYDGDELIAEYDSNGVMAKRYVHSDNVDDPVVQYDGAAVGQGTRTYLMPDERGSIAGLFSDNGTVTKNTYDEYGIPGAANVGRFQYTGQAWLPELGMYHYKARIYSPTLGRFLQTDPIGYDDQYNLYAYVGDDPMNKADPTGKLAVNCNFNGDTNKGTCSASDDGDKKNININLTYSKTINGSVVTTHSSNSYSVSSIAFSQAYGAGINSIIKEQAKSAFGLKLNFKSEIKIAIDLNGRNAGAAGSAAFAGVAGGSRGGGERGRDSNKLDRKTVDFIARDEGITDRRGFGDFIESEKRALGMRGDENFTKDELRELARDFKQNGGN